MATARGFFAAAIIALTLAGLPIRPAEAAITTLNAWSNQLDQTALPAGTVNGSYVIPGGAQRLLVVAVASSATGNATQTISATYGGQALTLAAGNAGSNIRQHTYLLYLTETGINAATSQVLAVTVTGGTAVRNVVNAAVYAGVNQAAPVSSTQDYNSGGTSDTTIGPFGANLVIPADGLGVEIVNSHNSAAGATTTISTFATNWTSALGPTGGVSGAQAMTAYIAVNSTAGNTNSQHTASASVRDSMSAIALAAAPFAVSPKKAWTEERRNTSTFPSGTINANYTVPAGSNRVLVVAVSAPRTTNGAQTSVTASFNGDNLNFVVGDLATASRQHTYLLQLVLGSSATSTTGPLNVTVTGGTANLNHVYAAVYEGVDQSSPVTNSVNYTSIDADVDPIPGFSPTLTIDTGDLGVEIVTLLRNNNTGFRTITFPSVNWTNPIAPTGGGTTDGIVAYIGVNSTPPSSTSAHNPSGTTRASMSGMTLNAYVPPIGPSMAYNPAAGDTSGTGGPVNFTGVTTPGSTGNGTIVATPSGGVGGFTTTLTSFSLSGGDAADFAVTSAATLTFTAGVNTPQNITMTCTSGSTLRTTNLQATETINGGATTSRFWVLNCPAGTLGPDLGYSPTAGASSGQGGPVDFTGVTTDGSTGNGVIAVTPSGGLAGGSTTLGSFTITGASAAFFTRTSADTLTFPTGSSAQNATFTCVAAPAPRSAILQATETIQNGAITQRFWVLRCPAGTLVAPVITSVNNTSFTALSPGTFTVEASGSAPITFTRGGVALPAGVTFDGTNGILSGTPAAGTQGSYIISFTATNAAGSSSVQTFTLTVVTAGANAATVGVIYTYDNETPVAINNNSCATRTFSVPQSFNVGGSGTISVGTIVSHPIRNELILTLTAPNGAVQTLQSLGGGAVANLNVMYSSNTDGGDNSVEEQTNANTNPILNDADPLDVGLVGGVGTIFYRRLVGAVGLDTFYAGPANGAGPGPGTWTLTVCDNGGANNSGQIVRARLVLRDVAATVPQVCSTRAGYDWGLNGNSANFTSAVAGSVTITETNTSVEPPGDTRASFITCNAGTGANTCVASRGLHNGYYAFSMDTTGDSELSAESALFTFSEPVEGFSFTVLDNDLLTSYEDYFRVEATDPDGNPVPYQIDIFNTTYMGLAGDIVEGDLSANDNENFGNAQYRFAGIVKTVKISYLQGNLNNTNSSQQYIGISDFEFCAFDFGDGPSSYATTTARHGLLNRTSLYIGTTGPDGEFEPLPGAGATSDGADEGTTTFLPYTSVQPGSDKTTPQPAAMTCNGFTTTNGDYCHAMSVTNNVGTAAQFVGFIDFNGDGDFNDTGERSLPDLGGAVFAGATDGNWATGNIAANSGTQTVVLVWSGFAPPTTEGTVARFRITTDATYANGTPPAPDAVLSDGEIEDHTINAGTLPVTLAFVEAQRLDGQRIRVTWSTATETGTMGYRVLQGLGGDIEALGSELIASNDLSSTRPAEYGATFFTTSDAPLYLEELSATGTLERFGPYQIGVPSGARQVLTPVPWTQVRAEVDAHASQDRLARINRGRQRGTAAADILVAKTGLQQISAADLAAAGVDVVGRQVSELRLSHGSSTVPVRVVGGSVVTAQSLLEFYGEAVQGSQYTNVRPYTLQVAPGGADWTQVSGAPVPGPLARQRIHEVSLDQNRFYSVSISGADPWYFDVIARTSGAVSKQWNIALADVDREHHAEVKLDLHGGSSYANEATDHRYRVLLNGVAIGNVAFDGITAYSARFPVPGSMLQIGANTVRLESIPTGQQIDRVYIDRIAIQHQSKLIAEGGQIEFAANAAVPVTEGIFGTGFDFGTSTTLPCGSGCEQFEVAGFSGSDIVVLQQSDLGPIELVDVAVTQAAGAWNVQVRPLPLGSNEGGATLGGDLVVAERSGAHQPAIRPSIALDHPLAGGAADLMVIASSRFAGSVDALVAARQAEGLRVRVVDAEQIYQHYSDGVIDPEAIRAFVAESHAQLSTRYVLLVGGDTYDYFDYLGLGSVSDIPTLYRKTHEFVNFAPVDGQFGDVDGDGSPEVAIGRLPARTAQELASLLTKVLQPIPANPNSLVFVSERENAAEGIDYGALTDGLIEDLGPAWQAGAVHLALDTYPATTAGTELARMDLMSQITLGRNLVGFYGHASPATWARESLLQGSQLGSLLNNAGRYPVVTEFGCWGGYFVEPTYTTMNHAWLLTEGLGARAMIASSSLTETASDRAIARALVPELAVPGVRLGDALINARRTVWARAPEMQDVVLGMSLFGDPSARLTPED